MDVFSPGPFRVASVLWTPRAGAVALTFVCKASYDLHPGESPLAPDQDLPSEEESHWDDDPSRSLCSPCDLVPRKPRADVLLVGNAFAPRPSAARSVLARLVVGDIDKSIEVFGERSFTREGQLREGAPFVRMPLRWERAAGGAETVNPVGVRASAPPDAHGNVALPNLQPAGLVLASPGDFIAPAGFGPIAASWPDRRAKLGRHAGAWPAPGWAERPLPEDLDLTYFNASPRDQRLDQLRADERILLENLHPEHPRLVTALPGLRPRALLERPGQPPRALAMKADTLWIDTDRGRCTLTWRGEVWLDHRGEPGTIRITADRSGKALSAPAQPVVEGTLLLGPADLEDVSPEDEAPPGVPVETLLMSSPAALPAAALPFPTAPPRPPARLPMPSLAEPAPPPSRLQSIGELAALSPFRPAPAPAAAPVIEARPRPPPTREVLKLLWFDPKSIARIRRHADWRVTLAELELRLLDEDDPPERDEPDPRPRRDVFEILARARPIGPEGVKPALNDAIGDDGKFEPPLVLLAGELELPFDELATLKATAAAASPFALGDRVLKEQLDVVEELLKTPWLQGAGASAAGLTEKIREAVAQGKRPLGQEQLASYTERMLLEQRCYQMRTVYGKRWIRSLLGGSGVPVYVPEALRDELPMFKRFKVRLIGEVDMQEDQYESGGCAIKVVALGRVMG